MLSFYANNYSYKFKKILLDSFYTSDKWNIMFHVKYICDVSSYWVTFWLIILKVPIQFIIIFSTDKKKKKNDNRLTGNF